MDHDDSATATGSAISKAVDEKQEVRSEKESRPPTTTLSDQEKEIIDRQLTAPNLTVGYFSLFRYATAKDKAIMVVALISSIAAGAVMPLMTVSTTSKLHT
jgi:ATP-binding cassette subfamily B (MDR/TAP) protein 1